ncbi:MAG: hypothetical protein LUE86_07020 [Clostridiales bacterium]|nr:hypothetical protein [Clostridiales bacterium]
MRQDRRFQKKPEDDRKRWLPVISIPLIVILLIIVILAVDRGKNHRQETETTPTETMTETAQPTDLSPESDETESTPEAESSENDVESESESTAVPEPPAEPEPPKILSQDSDPAILALMETYFTARAQADVEAMNRVYGITNVSASDLETEQARMRNYSKYLDGFEQVATYVTNAPGEKLWLVYTTANIRFLTADTTAPMIMWCFVQADENGTYTILAEDALTDEMLDFVNVTNHHQEVRQLASSVNTALKEALLSDEDLNEIYGVLRDGSPVWEDETSTQDVIVMEETEE